MNTQEIVQKQQHGSLYISHRNSTRVNNVINYIFDQPANYNRIMLESACFSQTFMNLSSLYGNNKISFKVDNGNTETFTIQDGFYTPVLLMDLIIQILNTGHNYFTYTISNYKINITIQSGHTLKLVRFDTDNGNKIYDMLGFSKVSNSFLFNVSNNMISDSPINFQPINLLLLKSNSIKSLYQVQNQDIPFSIPISVEYGVFQTYIRQNDFTMQEVQQANGQQLQLYNIQFELLNEEFQPLQVPSNFTYCFKFCLVK